MLAPQGAMSDMVAAFRLDLATKLLLAVLPGVTLEWLRTALFADGLSIVDSRLFDHDHDRVFELRVKGPSRQFDIARAELLDRDEVLNVLFG